MDRESRRADVQAQLNTVSELTPFQRRFLIEYLSQTTPPNATAAYTAAGGTAKHADRAAYQVRHDPRVKAAIDEFFHQQEMGAREVIALLSNQARGTMADFIHLPRNSEGDPIRGLMPEVDLWKADEAGKLGLVKKIKTRRVVTTTKGGDVIENEYIDLELYDSQSALEKVGRYHGLFKDLVNLTIDVSNLSDEELDDLDSKL